MKNNWKLEKLGDICEFINGKGHEKLIDEDGDYIVVNSKFVSSNGKVFKKSKSQLLPLLKNDIVMVMSDVPNGKTIAKCFKIEENNKYTLNQRVCSLRTNKIDIDFLFKQLNRNQYFLEFDNGENQTNLRKNDVLNCPILIPPLEEQRTIVAKLDQAFAAIDQAKANIEKNIANAKELFQSKLNQIFSQKGDGLGYDKHKLGNLGIITSSKRIYKSEYVKEGIPFYRTKEIKELSNDKEISLELFISEEKYLEIKEKFGVPKIGDILMSAVGTIGEILVIENEDRFYFKDGNIVWFRDFKNVNSFYLKYLLRTFVENLKSLAKGAAYSALTIEKIKEYEVYIPNSLEIQQQIVNQLDQLQEQTNLLVTKYQQKLANLEELKKSILEKAFKGELS